MEELEVTLTGGAPWGFRIQGGREFHSPIRITFLKPGGKACRGEVRVGDTLREINGRPVRDLTHTQAEQEIKRAGAQLRLGINRKEASVQAEAPKVPPPPAPRLYNDENKETNNVTVFPALRRQSSSGVETAVPEKQKDPDWYRSMFRNVHQVTPVAAPATGTSPDAAVDAAVPTPAQRVKKKASVYEQEVEKINQYNSERSRRPSRQSLTGRPRVGSSSGSSSLPSSSSSSRVLAVARSHEAGAPIPQYEQFVFENTPIVAREAASESRPLPSEGRASCGVFENTPIVAREAASETRELPERRGEEVGEDEVFTMEQTPRKMSTPTIAEETETERPAAEEAETERPAAEEEAATVAIPDVTIVATSAAEETSGTTVVETSPAAEETSETPVETSPDAVETSETVVKETVPVEIAPAAPLETVEEVSAPVAELVMIPAEPDSPTPVTDTATEPVIPIESLQDPHTKDAPAEAAKEAVVPAPTTAEEATPTTEQVEPAEDITASPGVREVSEDITASPGMMLSPGGPASPGEEEEEDGRSEGEIDIGTLLVDSGSESEGEAHVPTENGGTTVLNNHNKVQEEEEGGFPLNTAAFHMTPQFV